MGITAESERCGTYLERYCEDGWTEEDGICVQWVVWVKRAQPMLTRDIPRTCTFQVHKDDCACCTTEPAPCNCPRFDDTGLEKALCKTYFYRIHKRALPCDASLIFKFILVTIL